MMKKRFVLLFLLYLHAPAARACDVCQKQQPKITQGITHGTGPENGWDWAIVAAITLITLLTCVFSLKYLVKPGEKNRDHIKQTILDH